MNSIWTRRSRRRRISLNLCVLCCSALSASCILKFLDAEFAKEQSIAKFLRHRFVIMKTLYFLLILLALQCASVAQSYTSYFTGDIADVDSIPQFGILLAGGATDNDNAMTWFLDRANGGDVLIIRASGADGYNDYLFSELGVNVNSVETILFNDASASEDEYVLEQIANAEAIFIAGGDQAVYVDYWKDTPVEDLLNAHINIKQAVIGGTSAGMAILGGHYFEAENGTVFSNVALANPYNQYMSIGHQDFLMLPYIQDVITDTHYDDPDRRGRHLTFLARIYADGYPQSLGIACNEYVATVIDENGIAYAFGEWPDYEEYVYFIRHGCESELVPENCVDGQPLTWDRNHHATYVYRLKATTTGSNFFSLNDWMSGNGGDWQEWWAVDGEAFFNEVSFGPTCPLQNVTKVDHQTLTHPDVFPTICSDYLNVRNLADLFGSNWDLVNPQGEVVKSGTIGSTHSRIDVSDLAAGIYFFQLNRHAVKIVVQ